MVEVSFNVKERPTRKEMKLNRRFSKAFLLAASAYRRQVKERTDLDFSKEALAQQYLYETFGRGNPNPKYNGYTLGKWILDVTISSMYEDHQAGLVTKAELYEGSSYFVRKAVKSFPPVRFMDQ